MEDWDVLIVVVIYNQLIRECPAFKTLSTSAKKNNINARFFIYDNSKEQQLLDQELLGQNISYFSDPDNGGISKAYNTGAQLAKDNGISWLLFSDQDSIYEPDALLAYLQAIRENPDVKLFCPLLKTTNGIVVSPAIFKFHRGFSPKHIDIGFHSFNKYSPLNSGLCLTLATFEQAGGYNELVKLDYSDFAFIKRLKKITSGFYLVNTSVKHSLSVAEKQPLASAEIRFNYLCQGALLTCENIPDKLMAFVVIALRSAKLTFTYKKISFLTIAVNAIIGIR